MQGHRQVFFGLGVLIWSAVGSSTWSVASGIALKNTEATQKFGGASAPPSTYLSTALLCVHVRVCVCMYVCVLCVHAYVVCVYGWVGGCHNSTAYTCTTEQQ